MKRWRASIAAFAALWGTLLGTLLAALLAAAAQAGEPRGEITRLTVPSAALGRDLAVSLYTPAVAPGTRLAVLYLLHGTNGNENDWPVMGGVREALDAGIASGALPPMLVVMPDAGNSWYANEMAQALTQDLPAYVDAHYPTLACRAGRAIGGTSMGGFGALLYAMDHPRFYAAAFGLSAALWAPMPEDETARAKRPTRMFRGAFGDPLDWRRFNAWNVFPRLPAYARDRDRTPVRLSVGTTDFGNLRTMNHAFVDQLAELGVTVPLETDEGGHEWRLWAQQLPAALRWVAERLRGSCPA